MKLSLPNVALPARVSGAWSRLVRVTGALALPARVHRAAALLVEIIRTSGLPDRLRHPFAMPDRVSAMGLGGLVAVTVLAGLVLFAPLARTQRATAEALLELSHDHSAIQDDTERARKLRQVLSAQHAELQAAQVTLLDPARINERIGDLSDLAVEGGLAVQQVLPGNPVVVGPHDRVPIRLVASGTYPTCARFVRTVHQRLADVAVESFEIVRADEGGRAKAQMRVDLVWYAAGAR